MSAALASFLIATGLTTPIRRAIAFGGAGFAFQALVQPGLSYTEEGEARVFYLFDPEDEMATMVPWYAWPLGAAIFGGVFI